ncbi:LemA family protein [Roseateles sp. SL47]|uniref:LemA family protein n=1 Tax=Roseateles sp. SL47 TaxID=2995138 RepID=UPI002270B780|nr:LemA family protein [Roseateles sp. SL47]WAC75685.1 LemA family protein [Roseateles sp. SL47]
MNRSFVAVAAVASLAVAGWIGWVAEDLRQQDQGVQARWAELHAAEQTQFAEVPAVLALADRQPALDATVKAGARSRCSPLEQLNNGASLIDDAQQFDHYKQVRAECTGTLFRLLAAIHSDPVMSADGHVQALGQSLTHGQAAVDIARERYRQALVAYNRGIRKLPQRLAAGLLGYRERPDLVRYAEGA